MNFATALPMITLFAFITPAIADAASGYCRDNLSRTGEATYLCVNEDAVIFNSESVDYSWYTFISPYLIYKWNQDQYGTNYVRVPLTRAAAYRSWAGARPLGIMQHPTGIFLVYGPQPNVPSRMHVRSPGERNPRCK
ncbi:MAG: hypothetical protein JOZ62_21695 [Acidobacteriaceae bacterium]|nr:hypothetical protein [Acidobacteriaceae bacterium]